MENSKLLATLRAFKALFDNLPRELSDEEYSTAAGNLYDSYLAILHSLLSTQHFALYTDSEGEYVSIFSTKTERESYINAILRIKDERKERGDADEITCKPITFDEFLSFSETTEFDLRNYSLDEDGAIEFERKYN